MLLRASAFLLFLTKKEESGQSQVSPSRARDSSLWWHLNSVGFRRARPKNFGWVWIGSGWRDHDKFVLKEKARQQALAKQLEQREKALAAREEQTKKQFVDLEAQLQAKDKQLGAISGNLREKNAELAPCQARWQG